MGEQDGELDVCLVSALVALEALTQPPSKNRCARVVYIIVYMSDHVTQFQIRLNQVVGIVCESRKNTSPAYP